jgi:hypothetical protein
MTFQDAIIHAKKAIKKQGFESKVEIGNGALTVRILGRHGTNIGAVSFTKAGLEGNLQHVIKKIQSDVLEALDAACKEPGAR